MEQPVCSCPIARLPTELLTHIFKFVSIKYREDLYAAYYRRHRLGFVLVTHVCRSWREIALGTPTLWCEICDTDYKSILTECVQPPLEVQLLRSQCSPISWTIPLPSCSPRQAVLLSQHTFRLRKLTVDVCHRDLDKFIRMGLMQPAPILESLIIKDLEYRDKIARALPSNMFSGFTPRLQRLHIHALRLPWLLPDLGGLTELVVDITFRGLLWHKRTYVPVDGGPLTTESVFYDALRKMTNLRRLVLLTCLPPLSKASTSEVRGIVEMPHLQLMKVGGEAISCGHVIGFVKRPATCQLHVHCILSQTANMHDIDFLLPLLGSYSQLATYAGDVHSLKKSSMRFSLIESYDDEHHVTVVSDSWDHLDQVYIDVSCRGEDAAPQGWCSIAVISKLFGAIPSAHVRSLAFRYIPGPGVSYSGWWHTVKLFPNLKHLHLSDRLATIFFIMAWSPEMSRRWARLAESTTDAEDVHILPELVSLKFWGRLNESIAGTALKDALFKALVGRKNAGLPLRKLFLGGGREDADWVEACKELVTVSLKD